VIRRVFKWGVAQEIVPAEVYQKLIAVEPLKKGRSAAKEKARIKAVADSVVDETIPYLQPIVGDMVRLQRLCGARPGEIVIIRPMDLDRSGDVWEFRPRSHKNAWRDMDEERVVFLGPRAQEILLPYLLRPADAYCFSPSETKDAYNAIRREERQSPMTPSQRARKRKTKPARAPGDHYTSNTYRRQIERTIQRVNEDRLVEAEKAGLPTEDVELIPHWSPLQLRHSAGTEARKTFGLDGAQIMLGHKHARISEVYAEKSAEVGRLIASRIG
jgi:integrase